MTDNDTTPKYSSYEDYLLAFALTGIQAIMTAILQAGDFEMREEECVMKARSLYTRIARQIQEERRRNEALRAGKI